MAAAPSRALPTVIVDTETVLREADGPMKRAVPRPAMQDGWKGVRPVVRLKSRTVRAGEEPEEHKRKQGRRAQKFHFAPPTDICHLKNAELGAKHQKYKGRVVLRGDIVKDD